METVSLAKSFGGVQGVYKHSAKSTNCDMTFAVFTPPHAEKDPVPVLWYLSGLTCSHVNVMDKGEYRRLAAKLGVAVICPDTSPRGEHVPDEADNWQFGAGAGFYLDATQAPFEKYYRMYSYITNELPEVVKKNFNFDMGRQSIMGHSMGGHGALTIALKNPDRYLSCSAFAPIVSPFLRMVCGRGCCRMNVRKQAYRLSYVCRMDMTIPIISFLLLWMTTLGGTILF